MIPFVAFSNYKSTNRLGYSDNLVQNSTLECGLAMLLYYNTLNNMTMGSIARLFNDKQCKSIFVHITVGITTSVSQSSYRGKIWNLTTIPAYTAMTRESSWTNSGSWRDAYSVTSDSSCIGAINYVPSPEHTNQLYLFRE